MSHPLIGAPAPTFAMTNTHGRTVTSAQLSGTAYMLVFVPFAFSDTCTNELIDLRGAEDLLARDDLKVIVVSCDSIYTLKAWADTHSYKAELLSDFWPHGEVSRQYGVFNPQKGLATRGTFLVDAAGVVRWAIVNPEGEARDLADYRRAVIDLLD
ncbi:redoxin domain-containing protein [Demequina lignilytica]|uniref:Redoxin domain-containing protein n=1 Tax=Demequina lignilytica TaxID=3051663 RepID=A0AAW7M8E9_9MICO|nr:MULTISPECIES: redoxin domain-containing protein [unclassified Demequina]MDN4478527.1 redoxin domain-containing protein [Demequina sp. SYSU T00039-1]MDN4482315.1 redoxin domain-containing protein [Demequina sp. SYSU T0a273]MDN4486966.1 redoxin domain-containing protein [Demequina sp. SYSU T00039]